MPRRKHHPRIHCHICNAFVEAPHTTHAAETFERETVGVTLTDENPLSANVPTTSFPQDTSVPVVDPVMATWRDLERLDAERYLRSQQVESLIQRWSGARVQPKNRATAVATLRDELLWMSDARNRVAAINLRGDATNADYVESIQDNLKGTISAIKNQLERLEVVPPGELLNRYDTSKSSAWARLDL